VGLSENLNKRDFRVRKVEKCYTNNDAQTTLFKIQYLKETRKCIVMLLYDNDNDIAGYRDQFQYIYTNYRIGASNLLLHIHH
jgi:hypothetical protein